MIYECRLTQSVELVPVKTTALATDPLALNANPLGKIPALVVNESTTLFDSRVICRYLDDRANAGLYPQATLWEVLTLEALADGILEAALLVTYEGRYRPDQEPYEPWLDFQRGKIQRALAAMSDAPPAIDLLTVGGIGLACALEYMDFRKQYDWRPEFPALVAWLEEFNATHPAFADSRPSD